MEFQPQEPFDDQGRSPAMQFFEEARLLMKVGNFETAADLFVQAAIRAPHFKSYELLGECYVRLNHLTLAIPYLAAATILNRGTRAPGLLAETWFALGRYAEALEASQIALSRDSKHKASLRVQAAASAKIEQCNNHIL